MTGATLSKPRPAALALRHVRGRAGLEEILPDWRTVLGSMESPSFHQLPEWYQSVLDTWPDEGRSLHFFVAYREGAPVAVFPLQLRWRRVAGVPARVLEPLDAHYLAHSDFVFARTAANRGLVAWLARTLRGQRLGWDLLLLPRVLDGSSALFSLRSAPPAALLCTRREHCAVFRCEEGFDALFAKVTAKRRRTMRAGRRQLADLGALDSVCSRDPALLPGLLDELLSVEASGWKGEEGSAIAQDESRASFYRTLCRRFAASGSAQITLLRSEGKCVAGMFTLVVGDGSFHLKVGYDERFRKYSPGLLVVETELRELCERGGHRVANFVSSAEWLDSWAPDALEVRAFVVGNRSPAGRLAFAAVRLARTARDHVLRSHPADAAPPSSPVAPAQ